MRRWTRILTISSALGLVGALAGGPPGEAAMCQASQVKPRFTEPHAGQTVGSPVTIRGDVSKPAGCTTPAFTHVNLEIYRKNPATSGQPLQPAPGWGDVPLQNGQFVTSKTLAPAAYVIKARLVQTGQEGNYWGATESVAFTVRPPLVPKSEAPKKTLPLGVPR